MNYGQSSEKGMEKLAPLRAPPYAVLLLDGLIIEALLLNYLPEVGVAPNVGFGFDSSGVSQMILEE
jgi:hypothetical protein